MPGLTGGHLTWRGTCLLLAAPVLTGGFAAAYVVLGGVAVVSAVPALRT